MTPIQAYKGVKDADLNEIPDAIKGKVRPHPCYDFCAPADPGFTPSHRYTKTDNFKVKEYYPPEVKVRKFHDLNGNGIWDEGEPEIGVDQCVQSEGPNTGDILSTCGAPPQGGWPYEWTQPVDGSTTTDTFYTPHTHVAGVPGTYSAEERVLSGWTQTASWLDGAYQSPTQQLVSVDVAGTLHETHEIRFGNYKLVDVTACKYEDEDGDGGKGDPIPGWEMSLTVNGEIVDTQQTGAPDGCYTWEDLPPLPRGGTFDLFGQSIALPTDTDSYYDVEEEVREGWTATGAYDDDGLFHAGATEVDFESPPQSGASYRGEFTNFGNVKVTACKYEDEDGDGGRDTPIPEWEVYLTVNGEIVDTQQTGSENGCYTWDDLPPLPRGGTLELFGQSIELPTDTDSYYDVEEEVREGWTATGAYDNDDVFHAGATEVDFESPPQSGASYRGEFTNFENVDVTACKLRDWDGSLDTTADQSPIVGWTVHLTVNGEIVDTQQTGSPDGCYTWEDLPPLPQGGTVELFGQSITLPTDTYSYYDVGEQVATGWYALTPTSYVFDAPPTSGASYSFVFVNTPTQGCTPGFWQGGPDKVDPNVGGARLWDVVDDPDWTASGGNGTNPFTHDTLFSVVFVASEPTPADNLTMFELIDTGGGSDDWRKLARDVVAAYLNASWGMAYAYTPEEIAGIWAQAVADGTYLYWHGIVDGANNAVGGCPVSASGW
jgi:hypothetical protein